MTLKIALVNRSSIRLPPGEPLTQPLPGSEVAALNLLDALSTRGYDCTYVGNLSPGSINPTVRLHALSELTQTVDECDVVIWLRDYVLGESVFRRWPAKMHILWSQDTVSDVSSLLPGVVDLDLHLHNYVQRFTKMVFASNWHLADWQNAFGLAPGNLASVYNLASHANPVDHIAPDAELSLVNTSHPRKALVPLARVARALVNTPVTVTCFGAPSLYQDDSCVIVDHEPSGRAIPLGTFRNFAAAHPELSFRTPVPPRSISSELAHHHFLFHPDRSTEAGATTIVEAMRSGLPAIVSSIGPLPELIGDAGVVVEGWPGSTEFTDRAVELIRRLQHQDTRREYADRCRHRSEEFSEETIATQWCRLIQEASGPTWSAATQTLCRLEGDKHVHRRDPSSHDQQP